MTTAERTKPFVSRVSFHATPVVVITECMHVFLYTTLSNYMTAAVLLALLHTHIAKLYCAAAAISNDQVANCCAGLARLVPRCLPSFLSTVVLHSHVAAAKKNKQTSEACMGRRLVIC